MKTDAEVSAEACYDAFQTHYAKAQYLWVQFITEWLSDCSHTFKGDLQMMLILSVVGQPYLGRANASGAAAERAIPSVNASRIADLTGIPRETVRRKLRVMAERGWVHQSPDFTWSIVVAGGCVPARESLAILEESAIRKISRFVALFLPLVRKPPSS